MAFKENEFYLYREDGSKVINITYCRDCGNRYFVRGLAKTIYETLNEKWPEKQILEYKAIHNLYYEQELGDQMNIFDVWKERQLLKTLNMIAITESEQRQVSIPIELVEQLNEQMENFPEGMPLNVENGETIVVLALMLPTKKMKGSIIMFGSDDIWVRT